MSHIITMKSCLPTTTKGTALSTPFAQVFQLITDQDLCKADDSTPTIELERLKDSLCDNDLESMHGWLWYAGRKGNISPLHHQKVICRDVVLTERARLHLVWFGRVIYVQRLRDELLNWRYFSEIVCRDERIYQAATGFLLSFTGLVEYPSDLEIAQALGLINRSITWRSWQTFRSNVLYQLAGRDIHDRYEYGELRLCRLNQIYRMKRMGLTYFTIHRDYSSYFGDNYKTLAALFALVSVALSAMQVMTSIENVPTEVATTSYRFAIATLIALSASSAVLLALYVWLYVWNWCLIFVRRSFL
ncbi:hypothetical protein K431DRAFT_288490 [Polychaeton citri CBS 116435]|uniref:Uncharacterized protein n=1 Tax=Polychaeton citri CBS 116435 TaxID=1314669 RepID=A0A9P4Q181_9PEZI|nr:hypothetical protein K431DRAFT_288490 [Polychaeton citri CBS 116435]